VLSSLPRLLNFALHPFLLSHRFRYEIPFPDLTGEEIVYTIAEKFYQGNSISASDKLLGDFRKGFMGFCSLEAPEMIGREKEEKDAKMLARKMKTAQTLADKRIEFGSGQQIPGQTVGEELTFDENGDRKPKNIISLDVGKGDYEGW
jgi:hypothetical protein